MFGEICVPGENIFNESEEFIFIFFPKKVRMKKKEIVHQFKFIPSI